MIATLLLASSPLVGAEPKYPASDFQPEIVFQDSEYIAKNNASKATSTSSNETDSKYPAANFQPQVVYSDENYKHGSSSSESGSRDSGSAIQSKAENAVTDEKSESTPNYLIGLIGLAIVGIFLLRNNFKGKANKAESSQTVSAKSTHALTGVARYLNKTSGTGVSRYLDKQVKSAASATGVAKYVAKQVLSAKASAAEAATGVEKYMRNRG